MSKGLYGPSLYAAATLAVAAGTVRLIDGKEKEK